MILRHKLIATEEKISFVKSLQNALPLDQPPSPSIPLNLRDHRKPGFEFKFLQFIFICFKFLQFTFLQFKCVRFKFLHFNSPTEQSSLAVAGKNRSRVRSTRKERIKRVTASVYNCSCSVCNETKTKVPSSCDFVIETLVFVHCDWCTYVTLGWITILHVERRLWFSITLNRK